MPAMAPWIWSHEDWQHHERGLLMYMATVFTVFALISGGLGLMMPHLVHRLGFRMMLIYLAFAVVAATLNLLKRRS